MALGIKNLPDNAGDIRDPGSACGWGRSPGGAHGSPLQYSCLGNPIDRGVWWATVHRAGKTLDIPKQSVPQVFCFSFFGLPVVVVDF